jgi:hypothetical protein
MANAHWTWYFLTRPYIFKFRVIFIPRIRAFSDIYLFTILCTQICKDKDQAERWYLGVTSLVSAIFSPLLLVDSTSSRMIHSCTTSPPSYIQQRSRLFSVHDTRKYTQVYFGTHACVISMSEHDNVAQV